jgi:putative transposase
VGYLAFKFRVKTGERQLRQHAIACNQVWNFCVATQREAERRRKAGRNVRWPSAFDLDKLTKNVAADLGLHSDTVTQVCRQFVASRDRHKKCPGFRASFGAKRSLGWMPFIPRATKIDGDGAVYLKRRFRLWKSREVEGDYRAGSFVEDARGRWYVVFQCAVPDDLPAGSGSVGIDLGLKDLATLSDGQKIPALRHYRQYEAALAVAQRARRKPRVRAIHAKIANARRHHLHEQSTRIARENSLIVVGDVNAARLAKTKMAKSVLDAGWSSFRDMLRYKARRHGAVFIEADERYSSQVCSACGSLPTSRPKGIADLGVRRWVCSDCGESHDRDINAARNILCVGLEHQPPAGGIAVF